MIHLGAVFRSQDTVEIGLVDTVYRGAWRRVTSAADGSTEAAKKTASEQPAKLTRKQAHSSPFPYALPAELVRQIDFKPLHIVPDAEAKAYPPLLPG